MLLQIDLGSSNWFFPLDVAKQINCRVPTSDCQPASTLDVYTWLNLLPERN